ncbi:Bdr family repetitive protein [Borreliella bavariensis]|uniref:Bdr family repetitive protein n=1 Tax=Borreliella bavariensis TaxID=664662 RepID=UPI001C017A15|nr:Bdr family repetitive protein [Borreliella bavariensis]
MKTVLTNTASITEEQIYNEFIRLGMEQLIAQDLSKRYYHNELTYRDLENLEKQFGIKFDNLVSKIDSVEKNLDTKIDSVKSELNTKIDGLETKIDSVKNELNTKIDFVEKNLETKIDGMKNEFNAKIDGLNTKIENLDTKIDTIEKNLKKDMKINSELLLEKLKVSNRLIIIITVIIVPVAISSIANIITSIINGFSK